MYHFYVFLTNCMDDSCKVVIVVHWFGESGLTEHETRDSCGYVCTTAHI